MIERRTAIQILLARPRDLVAVSGLGSTTWDLASLGDDDRNFYLRGAMGGAAMIGLGLALARPRRRVLVITGDSEMLMDLAASPRSACSVRPISRSSCSTTAAMPRPACRQAIPNRALSLCYSRDSAPTCLVSLPLGKMSTTPIASVDLRLAH
jgi:hypothetical protein